MHNMDRQSLLRRGSLALMIAGMLAAGAGRASAAVVYNESVSGDAPAGSSSVNLGTLSVGTHTIIGGNTNFDTDDYTFEIPAGSQLDTVLVTNYSAIGSAAMQTPFLGSSLLNSSSIGQDFLDLAGAVQPVGPGTYLFRAATGSGGPTTYQFDLVVVPEPATVSLVAIMAGAGLLRRRRV